MHIDYELLRIYSKIQDILLAAGAEETAVAGGAIRDMLLEKPIKDIDVFYVGALDDGLVTQNFTHDMENTKPSDYEESTFKVAYGRLLYKDCPYPIQLIKVDVEFGKLDTWIMDNFGCNLSKVLYGGGLELTQEFLDDVEMEILTFPNPVNRKYMDKMIDKYPDFLVNGECKDYECTDIGF